MRRTTTTGRLKSTSTDVVPWRGLLGREFGPTASSAFATETQASCAISRSMARAVVV